MKTFYLLLIFSLFSITGYSQKCKVTIDPISNQKVVKASDDIALESLGERRDGSAGNRFTFKNENENYSLDLDFQTQKLLDQNIPANEIVTIKLEDGTVLNLKIEKEAIPSYKGGLTSEFHLEIKLSKEDIIKISNSSLAFFRIKIDKVYDLKPFKFHTNVLKKLAKCLLEN